MTVNSEIITLRVDDVVYRQDLYPRSLTDPTKVQDYFENLDVMPPIEVNQHNILIDGWHRWTAHKKDDREIIPAIVTETASESDLLELAIERNSTHGLQLCRDDKRDMARRIYHVTPEREREAKKKHLAKMLSVTDRTIRDWLSRIDKDTKESRDKKIFDMWMACYTQQEIADIVGISQQTVADSIKDFTDFGKVSDSGKATANHVTDFEPPIYNIWKQQKKTTGSTHFGNSDVRWLDNLLYLYTKPFDIVVDPFAGGGSTIDICKKRLRRYWVSDRKPIIERETEIRKHDLVYGLPQLPRWKDVRLVYLDPPYWKQAQGQYSNDPTDLANMRLDDFNKTLSDIINKFAGKIKGGDEPSYIALIIQPTQWKSEGREFVDHIGDMLRLIKLPVDMRFSVPYESQQCTAQMVDWAKENKRCLVLTREIIVWRAS